VKGREQRFMIFELLGIAGSDDPELRPDANSTELSELTSKASALFEAGDFRAAASAYRRILARYPADPVAEAMLGTAELMPHRAAPLGASAELGAGVAASAR
jgi:adenylate cyclase